MKFKFLDYNQNIIDTVLSDFQPDTLYIFPNESSRKEVVYKVQHQVGITTSDFITMKEFKKNVFLADKPILHDERRTILWYSSLQEEDKSFWRIDNYFYSIKHAQRFFQFWDELNEELVDFETISEIFMQDPIGNRQEITWQAMNKLYQQYEQTLIEYCFCDEIFLKKKENISFDLFSGFQRICIVNQFYFTKLEKYLIRNFPATDKSIILQLPEKYYQTDDMKVSSKADFFDCEAIKTCEISITSATNQWDMLHHLMKDLSQKDIHEIVDFNISDQPYFTFLSRDQFQLNRVEDASNSNIFHFFHDLQIIIKNLHSVDHSYLISLESMIHAFMKSYFYEYFAKGNSTHDQIIDCLQLFAEQDFIYIDYDSFQIISCDEEVRLFFSYFFQWLDQFFTIRSISEFHHWINSEFAIPNVSDDPSYQEVFYETLYNLLELESTVESCHFLADSSEKPVFLILSLFLDIFKKKPIKSDYHQSPHQFVTLQDTRNKQYENIAILNVIEGNLPSTRKTPFLFTENQRAKLGLKTYDSIILREKYYFYRLVAQTNRISIYTIQNIEENIEISSFIDEIRIRFPNLVKESFANATFYTKWYQTLLQTEPVLLPEIDQTDFFIIPFSDDDFIHKKISLSVYSSLQLLQDNYSFYWQNVLALKPKILNISADFEAKVIGIFIHDLLQSIWNRILDVFQHNPVQHHFDWTNKLYIQDAIKHSKKHNKKWKYLSPHNFAETYFEYILQPFLEDSILYFFSELETRISLSNEKVRILPEQRQQEKTVFTLLDEWEFNLKARADLLIEKKEENFIFDYKSSSPSNKKFYENQMQLYEWFYYEKELNKRIHSFLYFVMDRKFHEVKNKNVNEILATLKDQIQQIYMEGYQLTEKKYPREEIEITRRDLWRNNAHES